MKTSLEYRAYDMMDVKVDKEKRIIEGRAVVYNSMSSELRTTTGDKFKEIILAGALTDSLANNDVMAFKEHNPEMLLGRKSAGTLMLEDRNDGLYVSINIPETSYGEDTLISAQRGDLKGFSFGFNSPKARSYSKSGEKIREISSLNLREVSIVANPAYPETSLSVIRSEDFVEETRQEDKTQVIIETKVVEEKKDNSKDFDYRFKFISLTHK
jgi:HK97 family phage prohead protease